MLLLARILSLFFICVGFIVIIKHEAMLKLLELIKKNGGIYYVAAVRILMGVIFIFASFEAKIGWFVMTFGILVVTAGFLIFVMKKEKALKMIDTFFPKMSPTVMKLLGTVPLLLGYLLLRAL